MGPTERRPRRRRVAFWLAFGLLLAFGAFAYYGMVVVPRDAGDRPSGVACEQRPTRVEVEEALDSRPELVSRIEAVDASVLIQVATCDPDDARAEIIVFVPSRAASDEVAAILADQTFGVPVSIRNT